ncbi:MAG TPA: hypothetical protein PKO15_04030 [Fibrobacteria bacterium]|nr:hypothetical protein [Fibrobacteria bacterium]HOX52827.1 hypothetical protein [Fibrobacteria bacterium]
MTKSSFFIVAIASLLASCTSDPVSPGATEPTATRWLSTPQSDDAELYELWTSTTDSFRLTEFEKDSVNAWKLTNVMLAGRIVERDGSRLKLGSVEGKLASRVQGNWIRLDTSHGKRILMLASYRLEATKADPATFLGLWHIENHYKVGTGDVELREESIWVFAKNSRFETGTWSIRIPTKESLDSSGMDLGLSTYLAGKPSLQLFNSVYLVEPNTTGLWIDQWGDQAALSFSPAP